MQGLAKSFPSPGTGEFAAFLREKADWVRLQTLMIHKIAPETRVASSLSPVEIFTALYYGSILRFDAKRPQWDDRDRVVISKGHGSLSMYPILADLGFFPMGELKKVCSEGSFLGGIPDPIIPGYETVNGSLGHGLGVGCGMALALKTRDRDASVFVITGDGELHEGSIWEALLFAGHHKLDNLNILVDRNHRCMLGDMNKILGLDPLDKKFEAFGLKARSVDGHDVVACRAVMAELQADRSGQPKVLICNTVKGKGAPQLEANPMCHVTGLKPQEIEDILEEYW
jgi:transketolase